MDLILRSLVEFGLNEKEAKVYLALLELEIANVQEIAKAAGVNRSSAYVTLESLKKRGLVALSDDKKVRQYLATSPEALLHLAQDNASKQLNIRNKIEEIVPNLKALYKGLKKKPVVRVYEGKEGILASFRETLDTKERVMRVYSSPGNIGPYVADHIPAYIAERYKRGIKMFGIHPNNEVNRELEKHLPENDDEYYLIPDPNRKTADLAIFDNKITYMSSESAEIAVTIESREMADVMKLIFDLAFKEAKRLNESVIKNSAKTKKNNRDLTQ